MVQLPYPAPWLSSSSCHDTGRVAAAGFSGSWSLWLDLMLTSSSLPHDFSSLGETILTFLYILLILYAYLWNKTIWNARNERAHSFKVLIFKCYVYGCFFRNLCLCATCVQCPWRSEEGPGSFGTGVTDGCYLTCEWQESNPGPLEEQVLWTVGAYLQV